MSAGARRPGPVAFVVLSHRGSAQVRHLVQTLADGDDTFVLVHHDRDGEPLVLPAAANVHRVEDPVAVRWGRLSQVQAIWRSLVWLVREVPDVGYVNLVSGQDYPAMPVPALEAEQRTTAVDGFMRYLRLDGDPAEDTDPWQALARRRYLRKLRLPGSRRSVPLPFRRPGAPFGPGFHLYGGETWWSLSREAVLAALGQPDQARALRRYLAGAPNPDEAFFQTLVVNQPGLSIVQDRRRFIRWVPQTAHPATLTQADLPDVLASGAFFARKFDEAEQPGVLDRLDDLLAGPQPT